MRRNRAKGFWLRLAGMLSALLIFSGCVTMEVESDFNEDGSATHSMAFTIDMSDLEQFGGEGALGDPFEDFEQMEEQAEEEGFRVERIQDGDIVGLRLLQDVEDSSDLGAILNNLLNASAEPGERTEPFSGSFEKDGDDFHLNLAVDGRALTNTAGEGLGGEGEDESFEDIPFDMSMIFEFSYAARLPGEIDEDATNGRIGADGLITWDIPLDDSATFTASSSTGSDSSNLLFILLIIGIVVLGLLALAVLGFFLFMRRRNAQPAVATPAGPVTAPPGGPPTSYAPSPGAQQPPVAPTPPASEPPATSEAYPEPGAYSEPPQAPRVDPNQPTERIPSPEPETDEPRPNERDDDEPPPRSF